MINANPALPVRAVVKPRTVLFKLIWIHHMASAVRVNANRDPPVRVADKPRTVLSELDCHHRMLFVVTGSAKLVYAMIIVVKIMTVFLDYIATEAIALLVTYRHTRAPTPNPSVTNLTPRNK